MNMNTDRTSVLRPAAGLLFGVREVVGLTRLREMAG
jgi:hypothetical protein